MTVGNEEDKGTLYIGSHGELEKYFE